MGGKTSRGLHVDFAADNLLTRDHATLEAVGHAEIKS